MDVQTIGQNEIQRDSPFCLVGLGLVDRENCSKLKTGAHLEEEMHRAWKSPFSDSSCEFFFREGTKLLDGWLEDDISCWDSLFSGSMFNFREVIYTRLKSLRAIRRFEPGAYYKLEPGVYYTPPENWQQTPNESRPDLPQKGSRIISLCDHSFREGSSGEFFKTWNAIKLSIHMSSDQFHPGYSLYLRGWNPTQLCRSHFISHHEDPVWSSQWNGMSAKGFQSFTEGIHGIHHYRWVGSALQRS